MNHYKNQLGGRNELTFNKFIYLLVDIINAVKTMEKWMAFDVKAKKKVEIQNPQFMKLKNNRWAVVGTSPETKIKVVRFLSKKEVEDLKKKGLIKE